ncbi:adenomatous polyposis coli protein isoform X1 [Nasonia vitripennis]|uniref:Uncharacterized protein n=1 Tax=Nasonia vitripennis TaxID=7425 RepID=A0A7M7GCC4_NASVI|nr:adenomatous polyposis coli protein isoform X1 [Nasonia vitripennis]
MDKVVSNNVESYSNEEDQESSSKDYGGDERSSIELASSSNDSNCWYPRERVGEKIDSRQRWSFGSDISVEAVENMQNRLCCSPVDEFDSTISSENEDLIVNNTDETDESYKSYIQVSPAASPIFNEAALSSDNKKQNKNHDVDTADDELIDYSKRYTTDTSMSIQRQQQQRNIVVNRVTRHVPEKKSVNNRSKVDPFGDYAETDLDQPTDYSLRYAEEDTDEEETEDPRFYCTSEQEDTVKSYYTEGTPYQTPCNFSNATSMSDLLSLEDCNKEEATYRRQFLRGQRHETTDKSEKGITIKDCRARPRRKFVSEDSRIPILQETPETCDKRVNDRKLEKLGTPPQSPAEQCDKDKENKAATFNVEENNYAQETPLMFSRCSSLDSLSDFEQHSIHDDRSSVISDFSHRTSGVVSPSELPDSPTQTVPPSPRRIKQQNTQNHPPQRMPLITRPPLRKPPDQQHHNDNKIHLMSAGILRESNNLEPVNSFFQDGLVSFKEESMPVKARSTTGSMLSALTIDDELEDTRDNREIINRIAAIRVRTSAAGMHQAPMQKQSHNNSFEESEVNNKPSRQPQGSNASNRNIAYINHCLLVPSSKEEVIYANEEEENDYMPAYANKEPQQNNRYRESFKDPWYDDSLKTDNRNHSNRQLSRSPVMKRNCDVSSNQRLDVDEIIALDTMRIYCTEDTPTYVSPYGSQSNLSALSVLSISDGEEFYGANFNYEDEQPMRTFYRAERSSSPAYDYNSVASSDDYSEEDDRRIDVSPFDSQMNLNSFSLLCIEEESEEEDEEEEASNETDKSARDDSGADDKEANAYKRLSYENSDYSDEDQQVLEEFVKLGMSKVTRRKDDSDVDKQ